MLYNPWRANNAEKSWYNYMKKISIIKKLLHKNHLLTKTNIKINIGGIMKTTVQVPVEVLVKYSELGQITPLKIFIQGDLYLIDKVYKQQMVTPRGSFGSALEYNCLIKGKMKKLYFDRYNNKWYVIKEFEDD